MIEQNPEDEGKEFNYEVMYISNDASKHDFKAFYNAQLDQDVPWCTLPWNDPRTIDIKNELDLEALP